MLQIYVIMRGCRVCFSVEDENLAKENVKVLNENAGMPLYHYQESKLFYHYDVTRK